MCRAHQIRRRKDAQGETKLRSSLEAIRGTYRRHSKRLVRKERGKKLLVCSDYKKRRRWLDIEIKNSARAKRRDLNY